MGKIRMYYFKWLGGQVVIGEWDAVNGWLVNPFIFTVNKDQYVAIQLPGNPKKIYCTSPAFMYDVEDGAVMTLYQKATSKIIMPEGKLVN